MAVETIIQTALATTVSGRCYPVVAPDNVAKPYITYQVISNIPTVTHDGATGTENRRMQIDLWCSTYAEQKALETSVKAAMAAAACIKVPISTADLYEPDTKLFRSLMEHLIWS